jgi:hypothetical protein
MSGSDFERLIRKHGKTVADAAYETKFAPQTIINFIKGKSVARRTRMNLEDYAKKLKESDRALAPTG